LKPWIKNFATSVRNFQDYNYSMAIGWFTQQHDTKLCFISRSTTPIIQQRKPTSGKLNILMLTIINYSTLRISHHQR